MWTLSLWFSFRASPSCKVRLFSALLMHCQSSQKIKVKCRPWILTCVRPFWAGTQMRGTFIFSQFNPNSLIAAKIYLKLLFFISLSLSSFLFSFSFYFRLCMLLCSTDGSLIHDRTKGLQASVMESDSNKRTDPAVRYRRSVEILRYFYFYL